MLSNGASRRLSRVKSKDTKPEVAVCDIVRKLGARCRVQDSNLPGKPDLVFRRRKKIIFVHGCFWHRHRDCSRTQTPASRTSYWIPKFARTVARDRQALRKLRRAGWSVLVVWECELARPDSVARKIAAFLSGQRI
ncbi:MAG: very short patch repair endonuclease [Candidatus Binataceae bacterium]